MSNWSNKHHQATNTEYNHQNVHTLYAFRERVDGHDNDEFPEIRCQQIRLEEVVRVFYPQISLMTEGNQGTDEDFIILIIGIILQIVQVQLTTNIFIIIKPLF